MKHYVKASNSTNSVYHYYVREDGAKVVIRISDHDQGLIRAFHGNIDHDTSGEWSEADLRKLAQEIMDTKPTVRTLKAGDEFDGYRIEGRATSARTGERFIMLSYEDEVKRPEGEEGESEIIRREWVEDQRRFMSVVRGRRRINISESHILYRHNVRVGW